MKITLPRQELQEALSAAVTLAGGRTTKQILNCVKLRTSDGRVEVSATDGEAALRLSVTALAIDRPGQMVAPADRLLGIMRELADVEVHIEADERQCTIRGADSNFRIFVQNPADFPPSPEFNDEPDLVVPGSELRRLVALTLYAAARETSRFAINGVLWEKQGKRLFLIATDGRRLARAGCAVGRGGSGDFRAILPSKALSVFEKVFTAPRDGGDWNIDVKILPNQAILRSGDRILSTVLVEGHFPDYTVVIPTESNKKARVNREELYGAVKRAALLTTEESRAVKLSFDKGALVITSQAPEQGDARVELPVEYSGEPVVIGFNPVFLSDALRALHTQDIFIELQESFRPGVVCGEDKNDFLYVVMPVSL